MMTRPGPAREAGFTLVELLVVLVVLGLLATLMSGSLRLAVRVWESGSARLDEASRLQQVQGFLIHRLGQVHRPAGLTPPAPFADAVADAEPADAEPADAGAGSRTAHGGDPATRPPVVFAGSAASLAFVGTMPASTHLAGLYRLGLRVEDGEFVLVWQAARDGRLAGQKDGQAVGEGVGQEGIFAPPIHRTVLLSGVTGITLAYYGPPTPGQAPRWLDAWPPSSGPPLLVRIGIGLSGAPAGAWPDLVIRPATARPLGAKSGAEVPHGAG